MTRAEHWTLNVVGGLCATIILLNFVLAQWNAKLARELQGVQNEANRVQNMKETLNNLVDAASKSPDPAIRKLLVQHKFFMPEPAGKK